MIKRITCGLAALAVAAMIVVPASAQSYTIEIGGGPTGGTFNQFTNAMAAYLTRAAGIQAGSVGSGGSVANVKKVSSGQLAFGLCYAVDMSLAYNGKLPHDPTEYRGLRSVGYLYGAPAQLVVRDDGTVKTAYDLKSKRVAVGNPGSGAAASAERFFRHIGVWESFRPTFIGYAEAASAFKEGHIDAFWVLVGYPNGSVIEASVQEKIALIDVGIEAQESGFYDGFAYAPTVVPAGTYGDDMPVCKTFQDATILTVHKDLPDELVYTITRAMWSAAGIKTMTAVKAQFAEMNMQNAFKGASVPLHPGALRFWREQGLEIPAELMP